MLMAWFESYAQCSTSQDGLGHGLSHWLDAPEGLGSWMIGGGGGDSSTQIVWKWKLLSRVQLCDPMDCSLPGSSVHGIL